MTTKKLHIVFALLHEAARIDRGTGVAICVHHCPAEMLTVAEDSGGVRKTQSDATRDEAWGVVRFVVGGVEVVLYGQHERVARQS